MELPTDPKVVAQLAAEREKNNWGFRSFLKGVDLELAGHPADARLSRSMEFQFIEPHLDNFTVQLRCLPVRGEQGHLSAFLISVLKYLNGLSPGCVLTVVDLAKVGHLSLDHPVVWHSLVFNDAPVAMFFTVFESVFGLEKHAPIFQSTI